MGFTFTNTASTTAAVTNRFVTSTNMKVGAYTIVNSGLAPWGGGFVVTVTHTAVGAADTLGTIVLVGVSLAGQAATETIIPTGSGTATGTTIFKSLTSATGAGWVIGEGNDTLVIGCAAGNYACGSGGTLKGILVNNSVAAAITVADAGRTIVTVPASQAAGTFYDLGGVDFSGYLKVSTTSTNDVTVFHSPTVPNYATT